MQSSFARWLAAAALAAAAATIDPHALAGIGVAPTPPLAIERYTLPNGLEVVLHEDHRAPVLAVQVSYRFGWKDDPEGRAGTAALVESLMARRSKHVEGTFDAVLERAGATSVGAKISPDWTSFTEALPSNRIALALWAESDRMGFLLDAVDEDAVEHVRDEERDSCSGALVRNLADLVRARLYAGGHPYRQGAATSAPGVADARAFARRYVAPNDAVLVIAGDLDRAKTKALVERWFGSLARAPDPGVVRAAEATALEDSKLVVAADVPLSMLRVAWPTPPSLAAGDAELDVASRVLAHGPSSRLQRRLVRDLQLAQDVSARQNSYLLASTFEIVVTVRPGKSIEEVKKVLEEELVKLRTAGPTEDELARARATLLTEHAFRLDKLSNRAFALATSQDVQGDREANDRRAERYRVLGSSDVQAAVKRWLPVSPRVSIVVQPSADAPCRGTLVSEAIGLGSTQP